MPSTAYHIRQTVMVAGAGAGYRCRKKHVLTMPKKVHKGPVRYHINRITDTKVLGGQLFIKVNWLNFRNDQDTWELSSDLVNYVTPPVVTRFLEASGHLWKGPYKIDSIVGECVWNDVLWYNIHWDSSGSLGDTWEQAEGLYVHSGYKFIERLLDEHHAVQALVALSSQA
jgi:hypothetical protein